MNKILTLLFSKVSDRTSRLVYQAVVLSFLKVSLSLCIAAYITTQSDSQTILFHLLLFGLIFFSFIWSRRQGFWSLLKQDDFRKIVQWGIVLFMVMVVVMFSLSFLGDILGLTTSTNQIIVRNIQSTVPIHLFLGYLTGSSILEELLYRKVLFDIVSNRSVTILVTSIIFAYVHQPDNVIFFMVYALLGIFLGLMRAVTSIQGSIVLHIVWNFFVFGLSFFSV